jgi:hypothetical protein
MEKVQLCEKLPCGCRPLLYALVLSDLTSDGCDNGDLEATRLQA